jgi:hypothetical protein
MNGNIDPWSLFGELLQFNLVEFVRNPSVESEELILTLLV